MSAFTTLSKAVRSGLAPRSARAFIIPLNSYKADEAIYAQQRSFQYFPSTIEDSKASNYQAKIIPGLSHPLYQWTSGGARTISFEAVFTRDRTYTDSESQAIDFGVVSATEKAVGFSIGKSSDDRNVDIPSAIAWLRSFMLPQYATGSADGKSAPGVDAQGTYSPTPSRPHPPSKLILGLPGVRINWGVPELAGDEMYCIMTGCGVNYSGFFHDGTPRIAKVALAFAEIIQVNGTIKVQDGGVLRRIGTSGYGLNIKSSKRTVRK
jgi:hypothetical protein